MTDLEELIYQEWKQSCKDSIADFSRQLGIPKISLLKFAYWYYPDEFRRDGDIDRLYKELLMEFS